VDVVHVSPAVDDLAGPPLMVSKYEYDVISSSPPNPLSVLCQVVLLVTSPMSVSLPSPPFSTSSPSPPFRRFPPELAVIVSLPPSPKMESPGVAETYVSSPAVRLMVVTDVAPLHLRRV
jgi:hypothetical protein